MGRLLSPRGRVLGAEQARHPLPLPVSAKPLEPLHENGVVRHCGGVLQQVVEKLVVAGCRHVEPLLDRLLFHAGVLPPRSLEVEHVEVSLTQIHGVSLRRLGRRTSDFATRLHDDFC